MVRFSCFSTPPINRSKKTAAQRSIATLQEEYPCAENQSVNFVAGYAKPNPLLDNYNPSCNFIERSTSPQSQEDFWRSDEPHVNRSDDNHEMIDTVLIKKSCSLVNIMKKKSDNDFSEEDDIDHGLPFDLLNDWGINQDRESSDNNTNSADLFHHENDGKNYKDLQKQNVLIKPIDALIDPTLRESIFSVDVLKDPDRDCHADIVVQAAADVADSGCSSGNIPTLERSYSVANFGVNTTASNKSDVHMLRRSLSFSELNNSRALEPGLKNVENPFNSVRTIEKNVIVSCSKHLVFNCKLPPSDDTEGFGFVRNDTISNHTGNFLNLKLDKDNEASCSLQYNASTADVFRKSKAKPSHCDWDKLTQQEFSIRRVEDWINQIDIHDLIVEEQGEISSSISNEEPQISAGVIPPKSDTRSRLAMEVAYNYISSLTSSSSSAQLANLGLIAIPILSPFVSLRVLNLSGNAIVHITPGSLPKGIHMLNLSKNNISTIEGFRDLTHLRVLDLNFNRIARIGHGLGSCSSIKELYLAGNKIGEVEGLHRLLKLNTLDLRLNKISTAKGLGQLAANYVSLQAINLEGNPAQKNVGDEHLRKFLISLLPNLVYYNKQAIRIGSKEASRRAERAVGSPHFDRGVKNEHKLSRRASHGSGLHQLASRREQQVVAAAASRKPSKERHVRLQLPPAVSALTKVRPDAGGKPRGSSAGDTMKRSRSLEGLGGLFKS